MADQPTPAPSLSEATEAAQFAPSSLRGWGSLQRELNVVLPLRLRQAGALMADARSTLAGGKR